MMKKTEIIGGVLIFIGIVLVCNENINLLNLLGISVMITGALIVRSES